MLLQNLILNLKKHNMKTNYNLEDFAKFQFTFETEDAYFSAQRSGHIPDFDIVRMIVQYDNGSSIDFPCKSRESFETALKIHGDNVSKVYAAIHYYDIQDYA
jgi:hypothetical protein